MSAQNKKAIDARRWRATATEKRRFNKVLNAYIHAKHNNIYQEVKQIYDRLDEKYPNKNDLTKTAEWKTWKMTNSEEWKTWNNNAHTMEESSDDGEGGEQTTELKENGIEMAAIENDFDPETTTATDTETTTATDPETTTATDPETTTGDDEGGEQTTELNENDIETAAIENAFDPELVENVIEMAAIENELNLDDGDFMDVDNIINSIIRDLQEDDELRDILNNDDHVQAHYIDEDEGIGLNLETELEAAIEPLDLEEEGFFFLKTLLCMYTVFCILLF